MAVEKGNSIKNRHKYYTDAQAAPIITIPSNNLCFSKSLTPLLHGGGVGAQKIQIGNVLYPLTQNSKIKNKKNSLFETYRNVCKKSEAGRCRPRFFSKSNKNFL